jgi:sugar phosphate isomerase/epimerase
MREQARELPDLNWQVSPQTAEEEIGSIRLKEVRRLRRWLYDIPENEPILYRTAPSLVARSETELFGASAPRFAFRAYLGNSSFVNARRVNRFVAVIRGWGKRRPASAFWRRLPKMEAVCEDVPTPAEIMRKQSCVGDSLLTPPRRFRQAGYHVLTAELGKAYGENREINGTPFVRHIRIGGGLCAQANCLMAALLLHNHAEGIHGVAEITHIALENSCNEIDLGGMTEDRITRYFQDDRVGLQARRQYVPLPKTDVRQVGLAAYRFASALRAYVASGMPAVLPVDGGRMRGVGDVLGQSVLARNNLSIPPRNVKPRPHAILIVGAHCGHDYEFLANDPGLFPFLRIGVTDMMEVRNYELGKPLTRDNLVKRLLCIPVTPRDVKLPLLDCLPPADEPLNRIGLFRIAEDVRQSGELYPPGDAHLATVLGEFRLLQCGNAGVNSEGVFDFLPADAAKALQVVLKAWPPRWLWVQYRPGSPAAACSTIHVWDAEQPPAGIGQNLPATAAIAQYLRALLVKEHGGDWLCHRQNRPAPSPGKGHQDSDPVPDFGTQRGALQASLLSSFTTRSTRAARKSWPRPHPPCDLYMFMQTDIDAIPRKTGRDSPTAVEAMAGWAGSRRMIGRLSEMVIEQFSGIPLVSIATFIPEVGSSRDWKTASKAIQFLVKFARRLIAAGQHIRVIELVAGSCIDGIWPGRRPDDAVDDLRFIANRMDDAEARNRLLRTLRHAVRKTGLHRKRDVHLALELEPGPLYNLRDRDTLRTLCARLAADGELSGVVGINMDISHYKLAKVPIADVWRDLAIRNRIVHSHISGHHRTGHLGDLPLSPPAWPGGFTDWLKLLSRVHAARNDRDLSFSGFVSLECESALNAKTVADSVLKLQASLTALNA